MDSVKPNGAADELLVPRPVEPQQQSDSAWSIRRVIHVLDGAIDTAGAQLARSAGLQADLPTPFDERERAVRRRPTSLPARSLSEEPDWDLEIGPM
ncbi:hypothetical protein [Kribbella speibonae]|uniref:Uncharacterized protein n=1 Tax=Kribbella speibonae TaxID=1572660 RepID=A0A4R0IRQ6_9ACTN|nr:hypothetical protein [Kribbella speibonae]TCC36483.1 hypothetical protein E0H92_28045 [Kribbella speibonae]